MNQPSPPDNGRCFIRLVGFRIFNYKVIFDTGFCSVNEGVTALIGKNESGKTIILEALKHFNQNINIQEHYQKENIHSEDTRLSLVFIFPPKVINDIFQREKINYHVYHSLEIEINKISPADYRLNEHQLQEWGIDSTDRKKCITLCNAILEVIPKLFFFRAEDELFPKTVALEQLETNSFLMLLRSSSNFDLQLKALQSVHDSTLMNDKPPAKNKTSFHQINPGAGIPILDHYQKLAVTKVANIADFYTEIFNQLYFGVSKGSFYFFIKQQNQFFPLDKINRLDRWYFTFYLILYSFQHGDSIQKSTPILLLDEPGVLIHSRSQKLLANKLEELSSMQQIIFTTHSPYMLSADKINQIRIVEKTPVNGTKMIEQINGVYDAETLSPLLTAIGMDLSFTINQAERRRNIIVEGVSDLYYIEGFKRLLHVENINIIYGGGAGNMAKIGTILRGWGCDILYLYDNDKAGQEAEKNLKKYWLFDKHDILFVLEQEGTIEDILDREDFKEIVLDDATQDYQEKNSDFIREHKINKVACALKFKEYIERKQPKSLRPHSMKNIIKLFDTAIKHFSEIERKQLHALTKKNRLITN